MRGNASGLLREANLERGRPAVDAALERLALELRHSRALGCGALKIIHGYGSTGNGGRIRVEARAYLARLQRKGEIRAVIRGEDFSIFDATTRDAFLRCPALRKDSDLERHNNGVTIIVL